MSYYDTAEGKQVLQLEDEITRLSAHIYAAEYRWLCLLAQFDELEGWCGNGINPDNSPLSRRLACSSLSQHFRLPHKYRQYSLGRRNHCDSE